ncbi:MAG: antibiotic biosynthesis monooxygenase [Solirubrobacterales bacterium]|nr:antibiotic biosynthesis monooxygenase [Solirubrobacterales bacterium]MCB8971009.1 antibiotic biosynthesis monooxygenase [Thermoleophilales bacterium]MCO5326097.1 antibiotic biosynthesis monooxygenase [Solirubrobacterales bacterium]
MIIVHGTATATEGNLGELLDASRAHVARSLTEPGCISHEVTQGVDDPNRLVFIERWQDMDALEAHFTVPASAEFGATVARLTAGAFTLEMFEAEELAGP